MKRVLLSFLLATLMLSVASLDLHAKKKSSKKNPRIEHLSHEDKELFGQLTKKQQKNIRKQQVETGYNSWMVKLALGEPYYTSEHHPVYTDYEQVWLYTKRQVDKNVNEEKIIDPVTNWPSVHRTSRYKTCVIGDFFLLFDRGVVEKIIKDKSKKIYGPCRVHTTEEFLPIVKGKVIERKDTKKRKY